MKQFFFFILFYAAYHANAQAPSIVKAVAGTELKPYDESQNKWKNQTWNGMVFYQGTGSPTKLCVTDGTTTGTRLVANVGAGIFHGVLPAKDFVYIITSQTVSFSPFTIRYELWKSDGSAAGTSLIYTLPDAVGISNGGQFFSDRHATFNFSLDGTTNILYFSQYAAATGNEIWRSDGTAAGTFMLKDIKPGTGGSFPWGFCKIGNEVFFNATEIGLERKLWKTDGTSAGTVQVPVTEPFFIVDGGIARLGNKMVLFAHNTVDGYEPYISDGTPAGTFMLGNFNTTAANSGNSMLPYVDEASLKSNSKYCFLILHNGTDSSLYRTDGTAAGTIRIAPAGSSVYCRVSSGGYSDVDESGIWVMKFNNAGSGNAETLYRSDGTLAGTYQVAENISYGQKLKTYKNALWFQARNTGSVANVEPWRSGGNAPSTNKAFEIEPGNSGSPTFTPFSSTPYGFFTLNNDLYFWASTSIPSGHNLYKYTGSFTFSGTANNSWQDSANWSGLMPPGITDSVIIEAGRTAVVTNQTVYAGTLKLEGSSVSLTNANDSLIINKKLDAIGNPTIGGNGVVAFYNIQSDTTFISDRFNFSNMAIISHTKIDPALPYTGANLLVNGGLNIVNNSQFYIGNLHVLLPFLSSSLTTSGNSFVNTNGTGMLRINTVGATGRSGDVLFPIGSGNNYNPVIINNSGTNTTVSIKTEPRISSVYYGTSQSGANYYTNSAVDNTWYIEAPGAGVNAAVTLQWNQSQELPGFNRSQSYLGHWKFPSGWDLGTAGTVNGANPYTITRTGITDFSPFGILNSNLVLPLRFLSFSAQKCSTDIICLSWKTADEQNVSHFEIERSTNGINFTTVKQKPANNQPLNLYTYADDISGITSTKLLYRIRQVDTDGKTVYSNVVVINIKGQDISIYPTVFNRSFSIQQYKAGDMNIQIFASDGKLMHIQKLISGTNEISLSNAYKGQLFYKIYQEDDLIKSGSLLKF